MDFIVLMSPFDGSRPGKTLQEKEAKASKVSFFWRAGKVDLAGPERLFHVLEKAAQDGHWIAVRGDLLPGVDHSKCRRTHVNEPSLGEAAHRWLMIDLDKHRPDLDMTSLSAEQAARLARQDLPEGFHGAACWYQATSNARVKPGLRLRLAFWLDTALNNSQIKSWAETWQVSIDRSIYTPSQPHFLSAPVGLGDPYEDEPRSGVLPGGVVAVPANRDKEHRALADLEKECRVLRRAAEGERRNKLNRAAYALASKHSPEELSNDVLYAELEKAATAAGLSGAEVSQTLRNAIRDGRAKYEASRAGWKGKLARDKEGQVKSTSANVSLFVEHHSAFEGLAYDERSGQYFWVKPPPWNYRDSESDVPCAQEWFQEHVGIEATVQASRDALLRTSKKNRHDPIQDYLTGLAEWDGEPRVETFFMRHLGVEDTPLNRAQTKAWFIQAARRAFATLEKTVKADYILGLCGPQGLGKSSVCRALCPKPKFFTDRLPPIGSNDCLAAVADAWIIELAELPQRRHDQDLFKAFISAEHDTFRRPYRRDAETVPRRCVCIATVNHAEFLTDPTGNRRLWPMECTRKADPEEVREERDQLWAEALVYARRGDPAYLPADLEEQARLIQDRHQEENPIELKVLRLLSEPVPGFDGRVYAEGQLGPDKRLQWITALDLAEQVQADRDARSLSKVKLALKKAGWIEKRLRTGRFASRVWCRPTGDITESVYAPN